MAIKIMENGILIIDMAAKRWKEQMVTVGGGNTRIITRKEMEHGKRLVIETDTLGNSVMASNTGMEYSDGVMDQYITESGNRIIKMVKDITGGQMAMNIAETGRMT